MAKPNSQWEAQAAEAAKRIEAARAAGEQLALPLADETPAGEARRGRGSGKAGSILREWAAQQGYRMPEDALAELAGLSSREDVFIQAMQRTEQVLAWAQGDMQRATMTQRLDMFKMILTAAIRAAEALLPYGLAKITPDSAPVQATQINVYAGSGGAAQPVQAAPQGLAAPASPRLLAPPPMPHEIQQNQQVAQPAEMHSDAQTRTQGGSN